MLTTTYSLATITAELDKSRQLLRRLQQFVDATWNGLETLDYAFLEAGYRKFAQFDHFFRGRKIELYLIPSLRRAAREAGALIADLESLSAKCANLLRTAGNRLAARMGSERLRISDICDDMQAYCLRVAERLDLEEQVLLPMARRVLSAEEWFGLAAQFLQREASGGGSRAKSAQPRSPSRLRASHADMH